MSEFIGTKLTMNLGDRSYDIIVKSGSLEKMCIRDSAHGTGLVHCIHAAAAACGHDLFREADAALRRALHPAEACLLYTSRCV